MGLQNNFKDRKYYFWAVFMCYLISISPSSGEVDRKLFGTLAYRMISKAADSVPSDPVWDLVTFNSLRLMIPNCSPFCFIERIAEPV